jgi:hypothetical protein
MALIRATVRIPVDVEGGERVVLVCRRPTAAETSHHLTARFRQKGSRIQNNSTEAREALMDKILVDVEGVEYERPDHSAVKLSAATVFTDEEKAYLSSIFGGRVETWKDAIPVNWKSSAATYFEDNANPSAADDDGPN